MHWYEVIVKTLDQSHIEYLITNRETSIFDFEINKKYKILLDKNNKLDKFYMRVFDIVGTNTGAIVLGSDALLEVTAIPLKTVLINIRYYVSESRQ